MKNEIAYEQAYDFVKEKFPDLSINEDIKSGDLRGEYNPDTKVLKVHQKTSHTLFHELGKHISLSDLELAEFEEEDSMKNEILTEIT